MISIETSESNFWGMMKKKLRNSNQFCEFMSSFIIGWSGINPMPRKPLHCTGEANNLRRYPVAPLAWVPWDPRNPSISEQWVPEPINFEP